MVINFTSYPSATDVAKAVAEQLDYDQDAVVLVHSLPHNNNDVEREVKNLARDYDIDYSDVESRSLRSARRIVVFWHGCRSSQLG